jgi:hypothetical protein
MEGITREYVEEQIAEVKEILSKLDVDGLDEELCARVCGRMALIWMTFESLAGHIPEPPSMWLGKIAGMMLASEVETMQDYIEAEVARMAQDN